MSTRIEAAGLAAGQPDAPSSGGDRRATKPPKQGRGLMSDGRRRSPVAIVVMTALVALWLLPTIGLLVTSLRDRTEASESGWWTVLYNPANFGFTFDNYRGVLEGTDIGSGFINSLVVAIPATVIPIMFAAFAAYAFTFMNFRGKDVLFIAIVAVMVVPIQVAFQPMLNLLGPRGLGISGEYLAVWLLHTGFGMPLAVYTLRNYMTTLPKTVIESAKIDGASHFQTFWRLIVPMSVPALAAFAILQFLWVWNDLLIARLFLGSGENSTVIVELQGLIGTAGLGQELLTAGAFISMALPMVVFFGLQRFFVRGLTSGAVKG
ncbi:carbohydrate ABC transporter permease [Nocardioides sp.]|uniref:carbohydrate ABC transporter permease n=1 Tax=Nocardioides sp. TaxID=35761 RepID=UPI002B26AD8D|nr:carbohydrate ABC transporter permease [Nocardioides sp.]